ncbi:metallophosphoesterase family protein [Roseibacillus ishigakijimensis]|uniref:Serine/threonine protein phosphatase n=1 Tax=Roseibacillus ishigakijimensis TaxID=454146 RepID=A0A934RMJ4_9BACT|nr:metallophosphoesterase family protein [Roseibacillus ishigakijimensis]MBK1833545.1 serine/threonine protein phosphatase [Roseibacillus ishigakijimensis]
MSDSPPGGDTDGHSAIAPAPFFRQREVMRLAIGDIHGCLTSLETLLDTVQPTPDDLVVTLGDYVDRGPDSKGVIDFLLAFRQTHQLVHLMGNHEIQMLRALEGAPHLARFLSAACGGQGTLDSYGGSFEDVPGEHWDFMKSAALYHELEGHILVHAGLAADLPVDQQGRETYYYQRFYEQEPHCSGKVVVCGHTIQGDLPSDIGHAICLDTCAYGGGWLTALDLDSGHLWQSNEKGQCRELELEDL